MNEEKLRTEGKLEQHSKTPIINLCEMEKT